LYKIKNSKLKLKQVQVDLKEKESRI